MRDDGRQDGEWEAWMAAAQAGDARAYDRLLRACLPLHRAIARRRIQNPAEAEDAVQDALLTIHQLRHTYDPTRPIRPWLGAITERRAIDRLRRHGRRGGCETSIDDFGETLASPGANTGEASVAASELRAAVADLPQAQCTALRLAKLEDLSLAEASARSDMSVGALKLATHRAVKALRRRLGTEDWVHTDELIGRLTTTLAPVRRLPSPSRQALLWLGGAAGAIVVAVALHGPRPDLAERLGLTFEVAQWLASIAVGATAAMAAATLARPDRSAAWALLPLPALAAWLGSLGWGCLADLARLGPAALTLGTSWPCLRFIVLLGVPLTAALLFLLRHAGPVRPTPVLLLGGLAAAALCSAGLSLFHHLDAAAMVLVWHGGATLVLVALGWLFGGPLLVRPISR